MHFGLFEVSPINSPGPLVVIAWHLGQGKEQRLHFAGAAAKRYPTSKVEKPK